MVNPIGYILYLRDRREINIVNNINRRKYYYIYSRI